MSANAGALKFWPRALSTSPYVMDLVARTGDGLQWTGPIWSFRSQAR